MVQGGVGWLLAGKGHPGAVTPSDLGISQLPLQPAIPGPLPQPCARAGDLGERWDAHSELGR